MEVHKREIQTYETLEGKIPFEDWLDALRDREGKAKIKGRIQRVALGNLGDCKSVGEGVSELKIDWATGFISQKETQLLYSSFSVEIKVPKIEIFAKPKNIG